MTPAEAAAALAALDGALTLVEFISDQVEKAKKEGLISVNDQALRRERYQRVLARVGTARFDETPG